jgi:hypothetical protein
MAKAYDPARIKADGSLVSNYIIATAGDRPFIPGYPDPYTNMAGDVAECDKLSPYNNTHLAGEPSVGPTGTTYATTSILTSDTTPTANLSHGDLWYNTNIGALMIYVDDGDSSQWVQV